MAKTFCASYENRASLVFNRALKVAEHSFAGGQRQLA